MFKVINEYNYNGAIVKLKEYNNTIFAGLLEDSVLAIDESFNTINKIMIELGTLDLFVTENKLFISGLSNIIKYYDISEGYNSISNINIDAMENYNIYYDNSMLYSIGVNGKINKINIEEGTITLQNSINNNFLLSVDNLNDNKLIIGDSNGEINIVSKDNLTTTNLNISNKSQIRKIKAISNGQQVLTFSSNGAISLIDIEQSKEVLLYTGHNDMITDFSFNETNDFNTLLTSSLDNNIMMWDLRNKSNNQIVFTGKNPVWSIIKQQSGNVLIGDQEGLLTALSTN